jgi:hypothetical protein
MSKIIRNSVMASSFALMALGPAGMATAQDSNNYRTLNDCGNQQNCGDQKPGNSGKQRSQNSQGYDQDDEQSGDMQIRKKRRSQNNQNYDQGNDQPGDMQIRKKRSAQNNNGSWKYDSNRHDRRRNKNSQFRFFFGGYYYQQPYWTGESYGVQSYRVSCGEGRNIVDDSGYNRVRTIECGGGTFTYLGRRNGDTFKVFLNSRTGRIVGRRAV